MFPLWSQNRKKCSVLNEEVDVCLKIHSDCGLLTLLSQKICAAAQNLYFGAVCVSQASSSSDSLDGPCVDYAKSYDAVVFDVLKVTPEEFAVSARLIFLALQGFYTVSLEGAGGCVFNETLSQRMLMGRLY